MASLLILSYEQTDLQASPTYHAWDEMFELRYLQHINRFVIDFENINKIDIGGVYFISPFLK